ncbi:hypothetical protein P8452_66788 [Trifolium repens]|nr:hypothetical protein P8452_66788 [Trifolium repens]
MFSPFGTGVWWCCSSYSSSPYAVLHTTEAQSRIAGSLAMIPPPAKPPNASLSTESYHEGLSMAMSNIDLFAISMSDKQGEVELGRWYLSFSSSFWRQEKLWPYRRFFKTRELGCL